MFNFDLVFPVLLQNSKTDSQTMHKVAMHPRHNSWAILLYPVNDEFRAERILTMELHEINRLANTPQMKINSSVLFEKNLCLLPLQL